jgi:NAD+ synthase
MTEMTVPKGGEELALDCAAETARIGQWMTGALSRRLHRRGVVLGVSGGIDSAVCAALAVRALGPDRVSVLLMPEKDSSPSSTARGIELCTALGIEPVIKDIGPVLAAAGSYARRDSAIRKVFPDYGPGWKQKIVVASDPLGEGRVGYFDLVVEAPDGSRDRARMPAEAYREVVAATNMKQRVRKMMEYTQADRLNYAVIGTPNRLEYVLGFFVRGGDGLADLKPIAHLYKTQVYALAEHLGVPASIRSQPPTTDTYSLDQTQEEFYFALPWHATDRLLWASERGLSAAEAARALGLTEEQVVRVWRDFAGKRRAAERWLADAILVEPVTP